MKSLKNGNERVKEICDVLRRETIEPAKEEGQRLIEAAKGEAARILAEAKAEAERLESEARKRIDQEKAVCQSSLEQSCKQALERLRQDIEQKLFNQEVNALLKSGTSGPMLVAKLVTSMVQAIEKEGISSDFSVILPKTVPANEVMEVLGENISKKLRTNEVEVGHFNGGAKVKLRDKKMTIDISDEALKELLSTYVRKDFREMIFKK